MSRELPEWIGIDDDAPIPKRVKLRVWARCDGKCALSGRKLRPGEAWQLDHILALAHGGRHAEGNLQVVSVDAHKVKTKADAGITAKIRRVALKHVGAWPPPARKIQSRGFPKSRQATGNE